MLQALITIEYFSEFDIYPCFACEKILSSDKKRSCSGLQPSMVEASNQSFTIIRFAKSLSIKAFTAATFVN